MLTLAINKCLKKPNRKEVIIRQAAEEAKVVANSIKQSAQESAQQLVAQSEEDIQQQVAEAKRALMADINQLALQQARKFWNSSYAS